jgi:hypothetical protein
MSLFSSLMYHVSDRSVSIYCPVQDPVLAEALVQDLIIELQKLGLEEFQENKYELPPQELEAEPAETGERGRAESFNITPPATPPMSEDEDDGLANNPAAVKHGTTNQPQSEADVAKRRKARDLARQQAKKREATEKAKRQEEQKAAAAKAAVDKNAQVNAYKEARRKKREKEQQDKQKEKDKVAVIQKQRQEAAAKVQAEKERQEKARQKEENVR